MAEQIEWSFNARLVDGPSISYSGKFDVEAYDKFEIEIDASAGPAVDKAVDVQPGGGVQFLLITASAYDPPLTYEVDGGATHDLDAPVALVGSGAVNAFSATQNQIEFHNVHTEARTVEMLVGRSVAP